jgi:hypothetical protein
MWGYRHACAIGVVAMTIIACGACGGAVAPENGTGTDATAGDGDVLDASSLDSGSRTESDATASPKDVGSPTDAPSMPDAPSATDTGVSADATSDVESDASSNGNRDASADATEVDVVDAAQDAGIESGDLPCNDACALGDQQCGYPANQVCTPTADGGESCTWENTPGIEACVQGSNGCTVWGTPSVSSCSPMLGCCVIFSCVTVQCDGGPFSGEWVCQICPPVGSLGYACNNDTDCQSNACSVTTHECIANGCNDGRQDGDESDVDCGGAMCALCTTGRRCFNNHDCVGGDTCTEKIFPTYVCQ